MFGKGKPFLPLLENSFYCATVRPHLGNPTSPRPEVCCSSASFTGSGCRAHTSSTASTSYQAGQTCTPYYPPPPTLSKVPPFQHGALHVQRSRASPFCITYRRHYESPPQLQGQQHFLRVQHRQWKHMERHPQSYAEARFGHLLYHLKQLKVATVLQLPPPPPFPF